MNELTLNIEGECGSVGARHDVIADSTSHAVVARLPGDIHPDGVEVGPPRAGLPRGVHQFTPRVPLDPGRRVATFRDAG